MPVSENHLRLQTARLARHLRIAKGDLDQVAMLDLTHTLRVWAEMKSDADARAAESGFEVRLLHPQLNRRKKGVLRGVSSWQLNLPNPTGKKGGDIVSLVFTSPPKEGAMQELFDLGPPVGGRRTMSFTDWFGAEIGETVDATQEPDERLGFSREILIKRIANRLGASHPMDADTDDERESRFDPHINLFHSMTVMDGYPLTYYVMMCIANDLMATLDDWFRVTPEGETAST